MNIKDNIWKYVAIVLVVLIILELSRRIFTTYSSIFSFAKIEFEEVMPNGNIKTGVMRLDKENRKAGLSQDGGMYRVSSIGFYDAYGNKITTRNSTIPKIKAHRLIKLRKGKKQWCKKINTLKFGWCNTGIPKKKQRGSVERVELKFN